MPIQFQCRSCSSLLAVPDGTVGFNTCCPACRSVQEIPGQDPTINDPVNDKIQVPCPRCKQVLECSRNLLNTKGMCKNCQCVFVISDQQQPETLATPGYTFECPKCQQLFEGAEHMAGKSGRCHSCGAVFTITLMLKSSS